MLVEEFEDRVETFADALCKVIHLLREGQVSDAVTAWRLIVVTVGETTRRLEFEGLDPPRVIDAKGRFGG